MEHCVATRDLRSYDCDKMQRVGVPLGCEEEVKKAQRKGCAFVESPQK